jgi:hypothetical protein
MSDGDWGDIAAIVGGKCHGNEGGRSPTPWAGWERERERESVCVLHS